MKKLIANTLFLSLIFIGFVILTLMLGDEIGLICSIVATILSTIAYKLHRGKTNCLSVSIPAFFWLICYVAPELSKQTEKFSAIPYIIFLIITYFISIYKDDGDIVLPDSPYQDFMRGARKD